MTTSSWWSIGIWTLFLALGSTIAQDQLPQLQVCIPPDNPAYQQFHDYELPHTDDTQIEAKLADLVPSLPGLDKVKDILKTYYPKNVVIVGGSKGIGRANACYFAGLGNDVKVISLSTTTKLNPPYGKGCPFRNRIVDIEYDVSDFNNPSRSSIKDILDNNGMKSIDYLLLNAGRDAIGAMHDWKANDLSRLFDNNLFGLHEVWLEARKFFNHNFAVVLGVGSILSESRFFARRFAYRMTKQGVLDLMLGYAIEEEREQPHTHYGAIIQGDIYTDFGHMLILPEGINQYCTSMFQLFGKATNEVLKNYGLALEVIAPFYHKIYAYMASVEAIRAHIKQKLGECNCDNQTICCHFVIPQTYAIESESSFYPLKEMEFNHDLLPAEVTNYCYVFFWEAFLESCGVEGSPCTDPILGPIVDPRVELNCE